MMAKRPEYVCDVCGAEFDSQEGLEDHDCEQMQA